MQCHVGELLENVVLNYRHIAQEKGLELIFDTQNLDIQWAKIDDVRVSQILGNLIGNAIKFTESGYVLISCASKKESNYHELTLSVKDTGVGIAAENIKKIFSAF